MQMKLRMSDNLNDHTGERFSIINMLPMRGIKMMCSFIRKATNYIKTTIGAHRKHCIGRLK